MGEADELIDLNGVDGVTGKYLLPPMDTASAVAMALGEPKHSWLTSIWKATGAPSWACRWTSIRQT